MPAEYSEYVRFVLDQLVRIGPISSGRFFGGVGLSVDAVQFAMVMDNRLYFVVGEADREKYERAGMKPFSYSTRKKQVIVRRYYEVPEDVLMDTDELRLWAREAIAAAGTRRG